MTLFNNGYAEVNSLISGTCARMRASVDFLRETFVILLKVTPPLDIKFK
jgi:hypothetical protein